MTADDEERPGELYERIVERGARLHDLELASADGLGARAGALIGFAGVVLALTVALSRELFSSSVRLGAVGDPAVAVVFLLAVVCLVGTVVLAVSVTKPRGRDRVSPTVLNTYREERPSVAKADGHFGRKQQQVVESLATANTTRAEALQRAFALFVGGILLTAAQAVIIAINRLQEVL